MTTATKGKAFYDRQIAFLENNDVPGLIAGQYADDARIISFDFQHAGTEALTTHFHNYMKNLGYVKLKSTDKFTELPDGSIYFEATVNTAGGEAQVYDVFMLNEQGKATHHFTGTRSFKPYNPLTKDEVQALVEDWYLQKLDTHAPLMDFLPLLADPGTPLYMKFPEQTLNSLADFENWYMRIVRTFFDEVHTLKQCNITISEDGQQANVDIVVYWEASVWTPGDRLSKRIMMDAFQTWVVQRSAMTGKPVITTYNVDKIEFKPGSASL